MFAMNCNYIKIQLIPLTPNIPLKMSFSPIPVYVWGHALEDGKPTTFLPEAVNHQYLLRKGYSLESTSPTYTEALPDWIVCRFCTGNRCCVFLSVLAMPYPARSISQTLSPCPPALRFSLLLF